MHPISSRDENDSLSSTEEVSQLFTSTSRGDFLQKLGCERDSGFSASSGMSPRCPDSKEGGVSLQWLKCRLNFISQDEGMTESPVETVEKAIVLHLFWTAGLTSC